MKHSLLVLAIASLVVGLVACGSNGSSSSESTGSPATVRLASTDIGKVLVDGTGRTLYLFEKDKGPKSSCFGACASAWPPLTTSGKPKAGAGVSAAKFGTTSRGGGVSEVTYNGHPLYRYAGDSGPGQTNGEGLNQFGAEWYALSTTGNKVEAGGS